VIAFPLADSNLEINSMIFIIFILEDIFDKEKQNKVYGGENPKTEIGKID